MSRITPWLTRTKHAPQILLLGEMHNVPDDISAIEQTLRDFQPAIIAHELLYGDRIAAIDIKRERLDHCGVGKTCDPRLNKDIYKLGVELNCLLVGIDKETQNTFLERELHMVAMVFRLIQEFPKERIAIVVGDTHLRTKKRLFGELSFFSSLMTRNDLHVVRSPYGECP